MYNGRVNKISLFIKQKKKRQSPSYRAFPKNAHFFYDSVFVYFVSNLYENSFPFTMIFFLYSLFIISLCISILNFLYVTLLCNIICYMRPKRRNDKKKCIYKNCIYRRRMENKTGILYNYTVEQLKGCGAAW